MDFEVFISHGASDAAIATLIARHLTAGGIASTRTRRNLMRSRILLIVVTASIYGEEASLIARQIARIRPLRDPQRHTLCLRIEDALAWDGIEHLPDLNWSPDDPAAHGQLLAACRSAAAATSEQHASGGRSGRQ